MFYEQTESLIGSTPLLRLAAFEKRHCAEAVVLAKVERFNPGGSIKDRAVKMMLDDAQAEGRLTPESVVIEPTSGNTGVALAMEAAVRGFRAVIVMPETMSVERRNLMKAYGAQLILSDGKKGMKGAVETAEKLVQETPNGFLLGQFVNPSNAKAHRLTTGPEIWEAADGKVDIFIAGVGTGGTITGAGGFLKEKNPNLKVVAVEPASSPVLSGGTAGAHAIQGIGAGFIPSVLDTSVYDEIITVSDEDALIFGREAAQKDGLLVGISSGAALKAAAVVAARKENRGKTVAVILPDTGERYLSTRLFQQD